MSQPTEKNGLNGLGSVLKWFGLLAAIFGGLIAWTTVVFGVIYTTADKLSGETVALDVRLQREMRDLDETQKTEILRARERLQRIEGWRDETTANRWTKEDHWRFEDILQARIEALEARIRILETKGIFP